MRIATILSTFTAEAALVGEKVSFDAGTIRPNGEVKARLLGTSHYIRNNTDGYVILHRSEYRLG